jgi:hypothetical protein
MPKRPDNGRGRGTDTPASNLQQPTPAPTRTTTALSLPDGSHDKAIGPLRQLLEETAAAEGLPMKALTVLANQNDPFRVDTPAGHRDGAWLAEIVQDLLGDRRIHLRGLHYAITMHTSPIIKPNGERYLNDDPTWEWLQNGPAKDARWLGYLPFDQITDERNAAPVTRIWSKQDPWPYLDVEIDIDIPDLDELMPTVGVQYFDGVQPYKLVIFGEKSSLEPILAPVASTYKADLYLPTGEISDTMMYQMARIGAEDGRPMVVVCFSDADPSGWQMPISIARKLQAFQAWGDMEVPDGRGSTKVVSFDDLQFEVHRAAVLPGQVRQYGLPSSPLKATEKRADQWREAMGIDQTEVDALTTPAMAEVLRRIASQALDPFYDWTLDQRVLEARSAWETEAARVATEQIGPYRLGAIHQIATARLQQIREQIDQLREAMRIDASDLQLPDPVVPVADLNGRVYPTPLLDSGWSFAEQCRRLLDSKGYRRQGSDT